MKNFHHLPACDQKLPAKECDTLLVEAAKQELLRAAAEFAKCRAFANKELLNLAIKRLWEISEKTHQEEW